MKRILRTIIIVFILGLIALAIWFFVFLSKNQRDDLLNTERNLFPFGQIDSNEPVTTPDTQDIEETVDIQDVFDNTTQRVPEKKLRQISNFPTNNSVGFSRREQKIVTSSEIDLNGVLVEIDELIETEDQYVRYAAIENSSIYETKISPYSIESNELIENYIPNTEHAIFSDDGEYVLFQYWNENSRSAESYLGSIDKLDINTKTCPFALDKTIDLGDVGEHVTDIHKFLNRNARTTIALSGINSPGNEGNKATEATIIAIKNFQSLNELDIDGKTGPATRSLMKKICDEQEITIAEQEFQKLDTQYELGGSFIIGNITSASINPESTDIFYLQNSAEGTIGIKENLRTGQKTNIFNSPLRELYTQWESTDSIEITTKPSYQAPTYSYNMEAESGDFHKSLPEAEGMLVLPSPDNEKILISKTDSGGVKTYILNRETKVETSLSFQTFTDKCTWSKNNVDLYCAVPNSLRFGNKYPDSWYQGRELYNDNLYHINTETGQENLLSDLTYEYSQELDIHNINIDEKNEYLYFIDKGTEYLWSYRLFDI